mmetsp:Transcript_59471/g.174054  ORF Transcript_59471/g.174054 Transcript_59471/m.174054 type:complete len:220 (-) Transcript_59471:61-720(-)
MPTVAWQASPRSHLHGRGGVANVWLIDTSERRLESPGRGLSARGPPQTLAEEVLRSPRGRWRPPPRAADLPRSEASEIDHYGTSKHGTISTGLHDASRRNRSAFSRSGHGGPDLPTFRNLETAFSPQAQEHLRKTSGRNPRNPPQGATRVQDIVRKVNRSLDPYKVFSRQNELQDATRSLCFRREPAYVGVHGQDNVDIAQPGTKITGLAVRHPPSMKT